MLDDLQDTIEILKKRIRDHKDHIQDYESRTRTTLIDPMLQVLGWDVSDPALVQIEPKTVTGWADYALLGSNGKPIVFVEAKKLDQRDVPIGQIIRDAGTENYQNQANITYCLYTNGDVWEVINVREQDRVVRVSIATEDTSDCAMKLVSLWRASLVDGRFRRAEAPVIVDESEPAQPPRPPDLTPPQPTPLQEWVALNGGFDPNGKPAPKSLRLPNGQEININSWRALIIQTATWLHNVGKLTKENCQILSWETANAAANRYILSNDGKHVDGTEFRHPHPIADNVILEIHLSSREVVRRTTHLLEKCGQDPSQILLRLT